MSSSKPGEGFDMGQLHDFVAQELRKLDTSYKGRPAGPELRHSGYHEAAAVLSSFEVGVIKPNTANPDPGTITALLSDSIVVYDETKTASREARATADVLGDEVSEEEEEALRSILLARRPRWTLLPKVRRKVVEQLGSREALLAALAANEVRPEDLLQTMIESYLRGEAPTLNSQDIAQLTCTGQIVEWFGGVLKELPTPEEVASRLDAKRLLQSFEKLVGRHFSGRQDKLEKLYSYVGVLPTTRLDGVRRTAERFFNLREKPPLMIYGPGGVGKSTLVSKFILDHATLDRSRRFPYAYIDFDRPGLLAEEPVTLLVEAVRQLGVQYPDVRQYCDRVRRDWQERLSSVARQGQTQKAEGETSPTPKLQPKERTRFLQDFGSLLNSMDVGDQTFLLVLDTFEEVQYRSREYISLLWDFLNGFQVIVPRLRTVLSGRVPLPPKEYTTEELKIDDLDAQAARGFLTAHDVKPPDLVDKIVTRVGGSPLSLNLAVDVFLKEKKEGDPEAFFEQLKKDRIQSQLYTRILDHIHSEDLRQLAHPGLVLRRITPGLILYVLARPCGLKDKIKNMEQASALFDELSREFTLVIPAEDGALRHMPEVRKGMIELLRDDEAQRDKVESIQRRAVSYYRRMKNPVSRAEEIYHRLALGQIGESVASRWQPGVEPYLHSAVDELALPQQAFLAARLKINVDDSVLEKATQEDWEELVARQADALLRLSQPEKALEVIRRRRRRLPGSSLYLLKAQALERIGDYPRALKSVEQGLLSPAKDGQGLALDLRLLGARLYLRMGRFPDAERMLSKARELARESGSDTRQLEVTLQELRLKQWTGGDGTHPGSLRWEVLNLLSAIPDVQLTDNPQLLRAAVGWLPDDAGLILRGVRLVGLEGASQAQIRTLARALADWELAVASSTGQEPGALARAAHVPTYGTSLDMWQSFVQTSPPQRVQEAVGVLLANFEATPAVLTALSDIIRLPGEGRAVRGVGGTGEPAAPGEEREGGGSDTAPDDTEEGGGAQKRVALRITPEFKRSLIHGLTQAFPHRAALAQMLRFRMDLNLDSISLTDDLSNAVFNLVSFAEQRAMLPQLLAAARDSNPEEPTLAQLARGLGLSAETTGNPDEVQKFIEPSSFSSLPQWYATLAQMEGRICRVEINSTPTSVYGTGFLVGPDILLTSYAVVQPLIEQQIEPRRAVFRFDYKQLSDGVTVSQGTTYSLTQDWLIDCDPPPTGVGDRAGLNYALLRLEGVPGNEPVGGEKAEPGAPARGWINFPQAASTSPTAPVSILHYPRGNALMLTISADVRLPVDESGARVGYRLNTEPGSAGAPCFNVNWELVAVHEGQQKMGWFRNTWEAVGVSSNAIRSRLSERGFAHLLGGPRFDTVRLRTGRVFLNRAELRHALADLGLPQGRRILVVNGPPGSGKTYTVEFIKELSYNSPNQRVVYVNLAAHLASFTPAELLQEVVRQIGSPTAEMPALDAEQDARMIRRLVNWFRSVTNRTDLWLVLDDFGPNSSQGLRDLIDELQSMAATKTNSFRLVLLNYTLPLPPSAINSSIEENLSPLSLADVDAYLEQMLAEGRTERGAADETSRAAAALIDNSQKGERPSATLNMELAELLRSFVK